MMNTTKEPRNYVMINEAIPGGTEHTVVYFSGHRKYEDMPDCVKCEETRLAYNAWHSWWNKELSNNQ